MTSTKNSGTFSTLVVGTDGSENAARALTAAAEMASAGGSIAVHVVTAYQPLTPRQQQRLAAQLPSDLRVLVHGHVGAETILRDAKDIMEDYGLQAEFHEVDEDPSDALIKTADEIGADLIVVGSRGEGAAQRVLHGSTSTKVLHHAHCSVLVVK